MYTVKKIATIIRSYSTKAIPSVPLMLSVLHNTTLFVLNYSSALVGRKMMNQKVGAKKQQIHKWGSAAQKVWEPLHLRKKRPIE